jgi:hypothetical protein
MSDAHQVILSDEAKRAIERLKRATGADTTSQVMCQAVGLYLWALKCHEAGIKIVAGPQELELFSSPPEQRQDERRDAKPAGKPTLRLVR